MAYINLNPRSGTGLVTMSLTAEHKPLTFIIDTGSNISHVDMAAVDTLESVTVEQAETNPVAGISGMMDVLGKTRLLLHHDIFTFDHVFMVSDLAGLLGTIRNAGGLECQGIIGTDFLYRYRCHLDFKKNRLHLD